MSKTPKTTGLGKGLGALLPSIEYTDKGFKIAEEEQEERQGNFVMVEIAKINYNPYQPRKDFEKESLEGLKNSILEHGLLNPITVRRSVNGFELIAGERRLRAMIAGGMQKVPAIVLDVDESTDSIILALIENVQREDLNPIETAYGYKTLMDECNLTQEEVATKVGKDRSTITNFLRLIRLPDEIQESIRKKELSMGHARALLGLSNPKKMLLVWKQILEKGLSVRDTENMVRDVESGKLAIGKDGIAAGEGAKDTDKKPKVSPEVSLILREQEDKLRHLFGTEVKIHTKTKESGSIEFDFYSSGDFERLIELFTSIEVK
ncbi:MAG: ParB/RepB/Spo0J family partition protein [Ignavibacteriae bacterium]|nr:ParB/RepB/Spo0J family partition protein [Ignavibacteriota bacterium]